MNPKPNNCAIVFTCTDPKKCVHYRVTKLEKPCKECEGKQESTCNGKIEAACFAMEEYREKKSMCYYSRGCVNRCYNAIAQAQAMATHCKKIGLTPKFLSRSAECAEKNQFECGRPDCKIKEI
jgi:hypothetical protein